MRGAQSRFRITYAPMREGGGDFTLKRAAIGRHRRRQNQISPYHIKNVPKCIIFKIYTNQNIFSLFF